MCIRDSFATARGNLTVSPLTGVTRGPVSLSTTGAVLPVPPGDHGSLVAPVSAVTNEFLCL